jgi:hypothetical protein
MKPFLFIDWPLNQMEVIAVRIGEDGFYSAPSLPSRFVVEINSRIAQHLVSALDIVRKENYTGPYSYALF